MRRGLNMPSEATTSVKVTQAVPFFGVSDMEASLRFYLDGLRFKMTRWWIPDQDDGEDHYKPDGRIRWCWLELGQAAIMLQEFMPERLAGGNAGKRSQRLLSVRRRACALSGVQIARNQSTITAVRG